MAARLETEGMRALILRPAGQSRVRLDCPAVPATPNLIFDVKDEYWTLAEALCELGVQHVHFHHVLNVPGEVMQLIHDLNLTYDCTLHDYYSICPRINLINGTGAYCGEPSSQGCRLCLEKNRSYYGTVEDIDAWRQTHGDFLAGARRVFVPHADVAARFSRYFPGIEFVERRHLEHLARARPVGAPFVPGDTLRVALIGVLAACKGLSVILGCARDAWERKLPIRFHIIGAPSSAEILSLPNVSCTGAYEEEAVFDLLEAQRCHCAFFPSLWPETYSYTLSIALMGQLPPIAFDLGAQAARMREAGCGFVLPMTTDSALINDQLLQISQQFTEVLGYEVPRFARYDNLLTDYYGLNNSSEAQTSFARFSTDDSLAQHLCEQNDCVQWNRLTSSSNPGVAKDPDYQFNLMDEP
jgi:glycosyltransferase involved in cell wall biosynthesis